jgi:hypothetical protein
VRKPITLPRLVLAGARPGRNATGVSLFTDVLSAKRLELIRELIPNAAVIALLVDPNSRESVIESSEVQEAAHAHRAANYCLEGRWRTGPCSRFRWHTDSAPDCRFAGFLQGGAIKRRVGCAVRRTYSLRVARVHNSGRPYKLRPQPYGRISPSWRRCPHPPRRQAG